MSRHLADKRKPSDGSRMAQFLRLAHGESRSFWAQFQRRAPQPATAAMPNRRAVEFARIARGRQV